MRIAIPGATPAATPVATPVSTPAKAHVATPAVNQPNLIIE